ncbi:MAG: carboxyl-terminal processing protease [Sphingomonadales bacterium]|jgi:C-terminal processing protease CtpA/Prc|nr:carboxyl-terminal processing protease [Sphingomonadales bacterium]
MKRWRFGTALALVAMLSSCGGGGSGGGGGGAPVGAVPTPPPPPAASACSLRSRQDWALAQMREWYLFPETLPANPNPAAYASVEDFIDALTATARAQGRDRFFTFITSIAEENAFFNSGSSAGFGVRLSYDSVQRRLFVTEAFEGAPALAAGIDRGTEILAIGTTAGNLRLVSDIFATSGAQGVSDALGPSTAGTTRLLRITSGGVTREVSVTKADFELTPVSSRYGAKIIDEGGKRYGYVNLRTFINTADPALRNAFATFKAQGVTDIIVDVRYNGGGLVSIAELIGDLLGANRSPNEVFSFTTFRPEKSSNNSTRFFHPQPQSVAPTRLAFIGTNGSASASELIINAFIPYLHANEALIGTNTYGKPVGQIALDQAQCDDRLRVIAFKTENAARQGDYFTGLASKMEASCQAGDDIAKPLGDPTEASTRAALDFLEGKACTRISSGGGITTQAVHERRDLLTPDRPSVVQHEVPGAF